MKENYGTKTMAYRASDTIKHRVVPVARRMVASVRFRPTTLATITKFLISIGQPPRNISEISQLALESMEIMIEQKDASLTFTEESDAIHYLQRLGIIKDDLSQRNRHLVANNLELDSMAEQLKFDQHLQAAMNHLNSSPTEQTDVCRPEDLVDENDRPKPSELQPRNIPEGEQNFSAENLKATFMTPPPIANDEESDSSNEAQS